MAAPAPALASAVRAPRLALRPPLPRSLLFLRRLRRASLRASAVAAAKPPPPPPKDEKAKTQPKKPPVAAEPAAPDAPPPPLEWRVSRPPDAVLGAPYGPTGAVRATPRDAAGLAALRGVDTRVLRVSRPGEPDEPPQPPALVQARVRAVGDGVCGLIVHIGGVDTRQRVRAWVGRAAVRQNSADERPSLAQAEALRGAELYAERPETPQRPFSLRSTFAAAEKAARNQRREAAKAAAAAREAAEAALPPPPPLAWPSLPPLKATLTPGAEVAVAWLPDSDALRAPPPAELAAALAALSARFGLPRRMLALTDDVTFVWAPARAVATGSVAAAPAGAPETQLQRMVSCRCALCGRGFATFAMLATHFRRMHFSAARRRSIAISHASLLGRARLPPAGALFRFREAARSTALLPPAARAAAAGCRAWSLLAAGVAAEPTLDARFDPAAVKSSLYENEDMPADAGGSAAPPLHARAVLQRFVDERLAATAPQTLLLVSDDAAAMLAAAAAVTARNAAGGAPCRLVVVSSDERVLSATRHTEGSACVTVPWSDVAAAAVALVSGGKRAVAAAWSAAPDMPPAAAPDTCGWANAALVSRALPRRRLLKRVSRVLATRAAARAATQGTARAAAMLAASLGGGLNAAALLGDADDFDADAQEEWRPPPGVGAEQLAAAYAAAAAGSVDLRATADAAAEAAISRGANAAFSDIRRAAADRAPQFAPRGRDDDGAGRPSSGRAFVSRAAKGDAPQQRPPATQREARPPRTAARQPASAQPPRRVPPRTTE